MRKYAIFGEFSDCKKIKGCGIYNDNGNENINLFIQILDVLVLML